MEFLSFVKQMQKHVLGMLSKNDTMFVVECDKDILWNKYLDSYNPSDNPIYSTRREYDDTACRSFVKEFGGVVFIKSDNSLVTIWDFETEDPYTPVVKTMSAFVKSFKIGNRYLPLTSTIGTPKNNVEKDGKIITWNHLHVTIPEKFVHKNKDTKETILGDIRTNRAVFKRSLEELTTESVDTVLELISQGSLYRGDEWKGNLNEFKKLQEKYLKLGSEQRELFLWSTKVPVSISKIRNHSIGTLLVDLSKNEDLEKSLKKYESVVAPTNYKRPKAIFTKKMLEDAQKTVESLGLMESLGRRYATIDDVSAGDVIFVDRDAKHKVAGSVFDSLSDDVIVTPKKFNKVEEVSLEKFLTDIVPTSKMIEVLFENRLSKNLVSLISPSEKSAPSLLKWENNFSWAYKDNISDSMRERVVAAGGRVDGVLRFTHSWNHIGRNASLMDLHVFMPGSSSHADGCHDNYPGKERVGWNNRNHKASGGTQDVDYTLEAPEGYVPIENITFPDIKKMPEGVYTFKIHNWRLRQPTNSGVKAEIECGGTIYEFEISRPMKNKEWITLATATLKNGVFTVNPCIDVTESSKSVWGIKTGTFQRVQMIMNSPNHWDDSPKIGNKHTFFMLADCVSDETPNGFFNEFLKTELEPHRKVFEALGSKMKVGPSENQLSGIGFSSTTRDHLYCKVTGRLARVIKVNL